MIFSLILTSVLLSMLILPITQINLSPYQQIIILKANLLYLIVTLFEFKCLLLFTQYIFTACLQVL